jgi:diguanylate cyclase
MDASTRVAVMLPASVPDARNLTRWAREAFPNVEICADLSGFEARARSERPALIITDDRAIAEALRKGDFATTACLLAVPDLVPGAFGDFIESPADEIGVLPMTRAEFFLRARRAIHRRRSAAISAGAATVTPASTRDPLTRALTRSALMALAPELEATALRGGRRLAVHAFDVRGVIWINELFGRAVGDKLLQAVAERLSGGLDAETCLVRPEGGEFALVGLVAPDETDAARLSALVEGLGAPFDIAGDLIQADVTIGRAVQSGAMESLDVLLARAGMAAQQARADGYAFAEGESGDPAPEPEEIRHLARAITGHELRLHYQRQINLGTGALAGVESLLRWERPGHGLLMPASFLPLAAQAGQLGAITHWVLRRARQDVEEARQRGIRLPRVSVNVAAQEITSSSLVDAVRQFLGETAFPPGMLDIEVPFVAEAEILAGRSVLETLRGLGVSVTLEVSGGALSTAFDAGTAPVDRIKIDTLLLESDRMARIAGHVRAAGRVLVAGGIENPRQLALARTMGCAEAQGHYLGYPEASPALMAAAG